MMHMSLYLFGFAFFLPFGYTLGFINNCAVIYPDSNGSILVELGKEFTAVCYLHDSLYNSDDITWFFSDVAIPREYYRKINKSVSAVTVNISSDMENPLICKIVKQVFSHEDPCMYGIYLNKGYPPLKPKNLTCIAVQNGRNISPELSCSWDSGTRDPIINTNYTLHVDLSTMKSSEDQSDVASAIYPTHSLTIDLGTFPNHMMIEVWVEARNSLGLVKSDVLSVESESFAKPSPPSNVRIIPEDIFPTSLVVNWTHPVHETTFKLKYHIRYCQAGCSVWQEVSQNLTKGYIESFRLQNLKPYTDYVVQISCINQGDIGYWSDWSLNATARTPEAIPEGKPDVWRKYGVDSESNPVVTLMWKDPMKSNGKILGYNVTIKDGGHIESHTVRAKEHTFSLKGKEALIKVIAYNSVGVSRPASLKVPRPGTKLGSGVQQVKCSANDGELWVNWLPPSFEHLSEYVVEWVSVTDKEMGWQRVLSSVSNVSIKELKPFKRYNISVYPVYRDSPGTQFTVQAYLQQGPPLRGPVVIVTATGKTTAQLKWNEISIHNQQGFLLNYSISYKTGNDEKVVVVPSNTYSYKLTELAKNSHYVIYMNVSNQEGSKTGPPSSFHTKKYDDSEIDIIVVVVCLSFLFFVLLIVACIHKKKELIKRRFWPQVPDPSHSTIANWSPDCPSKLDTPKESILAQVSVVEVDMDDGKSLSDEDKAVLPLKKYFSEERSSGIGGSSGMSTPRQSVSSNDEADSGQTTASTVQYSAVVSSGYKGQTPGTQAAMFSRSESTQPLLECEENPEHLSESSSQTNSYFKRRRGLEQLHTDEAEEPSFGSLSFSSVEEEDSPTLTEDPPGPAPSYMPQQSGYRPQ